MVVVVPVAKSWADEVSHGEKRCEYVLGDNDRVSENRAWPSQSHKSHQMHAFILSLFQKGMNPAVVTLHAP